MDDKFDSESLLSKYFTGKLNAEEKNLLEEWTNTSDENKAKYKHTQKVLKAVALYKEMKLYNTPRALSNIHSRLNISSSAKGTKFLYYWQRVAAILLLPALLFSVFYFVKDNSLSQRASVTQNITTPPGIRSRIVLPDSTVVWLNSETTLEYPSSFSKNDRIVKLEGEAFFEVAKDQKRPFYVDLGGMGVEVVGTKFNVFNYRSEDQTEIVLASGKVKLMENRGQNRKLISYMNPGQLASFNKNDNVVSLREVDAGKFISWIDGKLIFSDDSMEEVIRRLNHWYNVDIKIKDPEIETYIFTATFQHENIQQVLELIKRTSPIDYKIIPGERLADGSFGKKTIFLYKIK